jgi:hypothetical protein
MAILLSSTTHRQDPAEHWNATNVGGPVGGVAANLGE